MPREDDYVCVRSDKQGVVWGTLVWRVGRECSLKRARQQYQWTAKALTLFELVNIDPKETGLQLSVEVEEIDMTEICGVILVPKHMVAKFQNHPAHKV